jgi:hypothetical protein
MEKGGETEKGGRDGERLFGRDGERRQRWREAFGGRDGEERDQAG